MAIYLHNQSTSPKIKRKHQTSQNSFRLLQHYRVVPCCISAPNCFFSYISIYKEIEGNFVKQYKMIFTSIMRLSEWRENVLYAGQWETPHWEHMTGNTLQFDQHLPQPLFPDNLLWQYDIFHDIRKRIQWKKGVELNQNRSR